MRVSPPPASDVTARASARRAHRDSPVGRRPPGPVRAMRRRSGSSAASRSIAFASAAGLSGSTSSAESPSASSSRAASVSAVITGAPVASASKTTAGIARESRKPPSTTPACASASPRSSRPISPGSAIRTGVSAIGTASCTTPVDASAICNAVNGYVGDHVSQKTSSSAPRKTAAVCLAPSCER